MGRNKGCQNTKRTLHEQTRTIKQSCLVLTSLLLCPKWETIIYFHTDSCNNLCSLDKILYDVDMERFARRRHGGSYMLLTQYEQNKRNTNEGRL